MSAREAISRTLNAMGGVTPGIDANAAVLRVLRGESAAEVAAAVGVPEPTLREWCERFVRAGTGALSDGFVLGEGEVRALFEGSSDFVFAKDRAYRFLFVNRAYADFIRTPAEEMVGRLDIDFWDHAAGEIPPATYRVSDDAALAGQTLRHPRLAMQRGGTSHVFDVHKLPLRGANGEIYGVLTSARNVTETFRAEEALRASEARYRLLLETAPVALYVHDGQKVLFANRAFAELMGASDPAAMIGCAVTSIVHPDEVERVKERIRAVTEGGVIVSPPMDARVLRTDGRVVPVHVIATRCFFEAKPAIQVVMIDETARLAAQAERETLEAQLRHAQRLEALGTLAGGIAHDFNNMLAVIVSNAELATRDLPPEHASRKCLDEVFVATERAGALVKGILAFSRKQPLERTSVRLSKVVQEATRLLRATLPASVALEVEADLDADGASVVADVTQVYQALTNLCTNAWHSMRSDRPGRIRISIEAADVDEAAARAHPELSVGPYMCICVRDDGSGMDAATMARVFDPFFTTKAPGEGTGLGLSVVHGIMRGHGGAVTVSSEPTKGTEFRLYFPAVEAPVVSITPPVVRVAPPIVGAHVLLVDDESAVLSVLQRSLVMDGHRVTAHGTFRAAVAELEANAAAFDVIVTDYNMPDGSGLELARLAQRLRPELPTIIMSGYLDERVEAQALDVGVRVLLGKPFSTTELTAAIVKARAPLSAG